jgi:2-polyprenyl-3-methyl-5-hydroxy-6-metoxy-1,4-benzoquinol methylase
MNIMNINNNRFIIPDDLIKQYFDNMKTYPRCKKEEYFKIKKIQDDAKIFMNVESKNQISQIIKLSKKKPYTVDYGRLFQLFTKFLYITDYYKLIEFISKENRDDHEIYTESQKYIYDFFKKPQKKTTGPIDYHKCSKNMIQAENMVDKIHRYVKFDDIDKLKYLDLGCGDCEKPITFGAMMKLKPENVYGADLKSWGHYSKDNRPKELNFIELQERKAFPIDNEKFDIVSCLMVLHHVDNIDFFMKEINRILKPGGILYIVEHDAMTVVDKMLADIEHAMYEVVIRSNQNFFKEFKTQYYDWLEWDIIMNHYGFDYVHANYNYDTVYANISVTRYYYAIYKKK